MSADPVVPAVPATPAPPATPPAAAPAEVVPGEDALGDPGKRALDAMKADRNAAREAATKAAAELDQLRAKIAGTEAEHAARIEREKVQADAMAKANERIARAEVRAAAAGKLADPADALRFINLSDLEVSADGETDAAAIAALVDDLIKKKPYLAAASAPKFGSADGGVRNGVVPEPPIDTQIQAANAAGDWRRALTLTNSKLADQAGKD